VLRVGSDLVAFLSPPADPGGATAAAFRALQGGAGLDAAASATVLRGPVGASTGLAVIDRDGGAVSCAFTMNNLFGTGRVAGNTGILLAAAPGMGAVEPAPLAAVLATNANLRAFRMAVAASGQQAAPIAAAGPAALHLLRGQPPAAAIAQGSPEPGRTQMIACPRYLPGSESLCVAATDPRGAGVALGSGER
jgi:gamma-glutamyltranspeptidase/glutathione hydrolase